MPILRLLCLAAVLLPMTARACDAPPHRQFDFWLGDWIVVAPPGAPNAGQTLGHNRIERSAGGCALSEHWRGAQGLEGRSLNGWDAAHGVWRQFWIGGDGVLLRLEGGLREGAMVLQGELPGPGGAPQQQRITWTPAADGTLTQRWETSDDGGATWTVAFLGLYRRLDGS